MAKATPQVKWETVIEVVKPSHYRPRNDFRPERRPERPERQERNRDRRDFRKDDSTRSAFATRESSTGGTFADFIRASEERKRRDEEKRKNKK